MKRKRVLKVIGLALGIIVFAILCFIAYGYYMFNTSLIPENEPFTHSSHYINPDEALLNDGFKICNEDYIAQYYNTQELPYPNGKNNFRKYIISSFENRNYSDSGYLNIRFIINCEGETGRFIIQSNDLDLNPKPFNTDLKNQLFKLTSEATSWKSTVIREKNRDAYMYVSYRIENGEITEIIP
ncbi:MAG: hypothetical protein HKP48_08410 [Winogradskyella sp.]|uniref:hypothetical protein n=1 Tax=Winogradskyella sp. TaxID=1883156 RepID=UPI0017B0B4AE|nr:hypothetical protein [Winogradskyella sp.]MBT8245302.1 hypothetical protein [Winogradskyella sp.]NNK23297.1 hypothetical protein [Winogradskyella sp.]